MSYYTLAEGRSYQIPKEMEDEMTDDVQAVPMPETIQAFKFGIDQVVD